MKPSQSATILRFIKKSGSKGVANYILSGISLKYSSRISELRQEGHNIVAVRQYDKAGRALGTWRYHLED